MRYEVERSLWRLKTDYIDLYQTHWQDSTTPIEDTMAELLAMKAEGKLRAIGVCNASRRQLDAYRSVGAVDANQERYSMLDRELEDANLTYCHERKMALIAYSTLGQGLLTGKVDAARQFGEGDQRNYSRRFSPENRSAIAGMLAEMTPLAAGHGVTLAQLAIAWCLHQRGCTHALVGARDTTQAVENAGAGDVRLGVEDLAGMEAVLARHGAVVR
jgi:aryl-alcohol dehydrogenase-like predicted oxidoreductase